MTLTEDLLKQISDAICRPEGSVTFEYSSPEAFRVGTPGGVIFEIPAGGHYFRLERTLDRRLDFYHSSPATGTRVASIDLSAVPSFERAFLAFVWSPDEINLHCRPRDVSCGLLSAVGTPSLVSFRVGADGSVFQIGGEGLQVMGARIQRGKQVVLAPTAREVWTSTLQAIKVLWTGSSDQGFLFEVLQVTTTLSMLVTGLENYGKARLVEIESEGVKADATGLFSAFSSKAEKDSSRFAELEAQASANGVSLLATVANTARINFQSFDDLKLAFRSAYGIKIGEIGVDAPTIAEVRQLIRYRHRVIHVSPLMAVLNQSNLPPEEPVFANRALADQAIKSFSHVVDALHEATTALRPRT